MHQAVLSRPGALRRAWWWAALASLVGHALVALWLLPSLRPASQALSLSVSPLHLKLAMSNAAQAPTPVVPAGTSQPRHAADASAQPGQQRESSADLPRPTAPGTTEQAVVPAPPATAAPLPAVTSGTEPAASTPRVDAVDGYVLRKALSLAPVVLAELRLPWPAGLAPSGPQRGVFSLFIDQHGSVDRMVADGPSLLPSLEASARAAFMAARFKPGEVDGQPVKSLIRVEVVFDNRLVEAPGATVVSSQNL